MNVCAKHRLADEYDAAQERGEVKGLGDNLPSVGNADAKATAAQAPDCVAKVGKPVIVSDADDKATATPEQWLADLHRQLVGVKPNDHERAAGVA